MQSLAVKYRPKTFDDVSEQQAIKLILREQIETETNQNCYLFTGAAGTGKTTCARIFASEINKGKGSPIEIDAASNNGVDNVRDIIDNAKFKAIDSEYKVYILDEVHMLSSGAWNALLKIIEEPPAKTIFIFCTTEPQKIPATILSRVQRFDFQRLSYKAIVDRLKEIINLENNNGEKIESNIEAIEYISRLAEGGMRDAITMLDKCLSLSPTLTVETVVKALGTVNYDFMFSLTDVIYEKKKKEVVLKIEELHRSGADLKQFIKQYTLFILDLCKYGLLGNFDYIQIPSTFSEKLSNIKQEEFYFYTELLDEVIRISNDIKWETNPKPIIESVFILLCRGENK